MDDRKRTYVRKVFNPDNPEPWFNQDQIGMPEQMKKEVMDSISRSLSGNKKSTQVTALFFKSVAAALILIFVSYTYEQVYSLKRLNHLENRLAADTTISHSAFDQIDKVLVLNSIVDWSAVKEIDPEQVLDQYKEVLPAWFNANLLGDRKVKLKLEKCIIKLQNNYNIK